VLNTTYICCKTHIRISWISYAIEGVRGRWWSMGEGAKE